MNTADIDFRQHHQTIKSTHVVHNHGPKSRSRKWPRIASKTVGTHCGCPHFPLKIAAVLHIIFEDPILRTNFRTLFPASRIHGTADIQRTPNKSTPHGGAPVAHQRKQLVLLCCAYARIVHAHELMTMPCWISDTSCPSPSYHRNKQKPSLAESSIVHACTPLTLGHGRVSSYGWVFQLR